MTCRNVLPLITYFSTGLYAYSEGTKRFLILEFNYDMNNFVDFTQCFVTSKQLLVIAKSAQLMN